MWPLLMRCCSGYEVEVRDFDVLGVVKRRLQSLYQGLNKLKLLVIS